MKILHTADWHLGKLIHGIYMTDDQAYLLDELIRYIELEAPDLIIIAGDIYDRAIPPVEAIHLLDLFFNRVALELNIPIIAISGNHDSPQRLSFGSHFLHHQSCHIITEFDPSFTPIVMNDDFGEVHFYAIPYVEPSQIRQIYPDAGIRTHDDAFRVMMEHLTPKLDESARNVLILHAFVIHSSQPEILTSDSERPLAIGGSEYISADYLQAFDYVALGHLHQAHKVKEEFIRYSGSLLKYSLSEATHEKGILEVILGEKNAGDAHANIEIEKITFKPKRDLREVRGELQTILTMPKSDDYCFVTLLDESPVLQPMEQIRTVFPNAMHVRRDLQKSRSFREDQSELKNLEKTDDLSLFKGFYQTLLEKELDSETLQIFSDALMQVQSENESTKSPKTPASTAQSTSTSSDIDTL